MNLVEPPFPKCYKKETKPHKFCPGCGHPIVLKMLGQVIDELEIKDKTVFLIDIGCSLLAWDFYDIDTSQTHHGRTIPTAVGFKRANPDAIVIAYMGDGGGYGIGMGSTIHAAYRNDPITTILVNNTLYAMTGGQLAPTSLEGEKLTTAPEGRNVLLTGHELRGPEFISNIASKNSYLARGTVAVPLQLKIFIKNAILNQIDNKAFSFVEALSYCPLNWKTNAPETVAMMKNMLRKYEVKEFRSIGKAKDK